MADAAEKLFEDEAIAGSDADVEATILAAGGAREAVRVLLIQLRETELARDQAAGMISLGYRRGRQPARFVE